MCSPEAEKQLTRDRIRDDAQAILRVLALSDNAANAATISMLVRNMADDADSLIHHFHPPVDYRLVSSNQ